MKDITGHKHSHAASVPQASGATSPISDTERLKRKVQKLSAVLDFYEDIKGRRITSEKELCDARQKMEFAKKQMLKLCIGGKKIIKETEHREIV